MGQPPDQHYGSEPEAQGTGQGPEGQAKEKWLRPGEGKAAEAEAAPKDDERQQDQPGRSCLPADLPVFFFAGHKNLLDI